MGSYKNSGPVDCNVDFDRSSIEGKVAIVTGGSRGIGLEYARALTHAGATVVVGDILKESVGVQFRNAQYVNCDVTKWEDQVELFKTAMGYSKNGKIDIVIANAGILGVDSILAYDAQQEIPDKPALPITEINLIGVMYTVKLALHRFRQQYQADNSSQSCLVLQGSLAGYIDVAGSPEYNATKFGLRGLLHALRQTIGKHNTRILNIAPWFVETKILSDEDIQNVKATGAEFALATDAADAVMRFLCDDSITGRAFAIVPRSWQPRGYVDIDDDDYTSDKHWLGGVFEKAKVPSQDTA